MMVLSENFKNRLSVLAGLNSSNDDFLLEDDIRDIQGSKSQEAHKIVQKLKIPLEIAEWAVGLSSKYAIWIANSLRGAYFSQIAKANFDEDIINASKQAWSLPKLSDANNNELLEKRANSAIEFATSQEPQYTHILDWLTRRNVLAPETDVLNFKTLTFEGALKRSEEWHAELATMQGGQIEDEDGEVIMNFPDGFYWINLGKSYCDKEAKAMGHCGRQGGSILYSLRKDKYPYVTAAIDQNNSLVQIKGRANTKPKQVFHKYIIPFILGDKPEIVYQTFSAYQPETDFNIGDLSTNEIKNVISKKPTLFNGYGGTALYKLDDKYVSDLLLNYPLQIKNIAKFYSNIVPLDEILRNQDSINWALDKMPELFLAGNWGNIKLDKPQQLKLLSTKIELKIDKLNLDDETIHHVVHNNPSLFEKEASQTIQKITDQDMMFLLLQHPKIFEIIVNKYSLPLNKYLRNNEMVDYALNKVPTVFLSRNWGTIVLTKEQTNILISKGEEVGGLNLDTIIIDNDSLNWIVYNNPKLLENSIEKIKNLTDEQKDYLVKNHPEAFAQFINLIKHRENEYYRIVRTTIGDNRLSILFNNNPEMFEIGDNFWGFYEYFVTTEMIGKYLKNHNPQNDPLKLYSNSKKLSQFQDILDLDLFNYLLVYYPNNFFQAGFSAVANHKGLESIGKYIIDHHFNWIQESVPPYNHVIKYDIFNWNLTPAQKQKIIESDAKGDTNILESYDAVELNALALSPEQISFITGYESVLHDNLSLEMITGFNIHPEDAKISVLEMLRNSDEDRKIIKEITDAYGDEYVHTLYMQNPNIFKALATAVKYKDIEKLQKYAGQFVTYGKDKIILSFPEWQDDELLNLFDDKSQAERVSNQDFDFSEYDYSFEDVSYHFDELNNLNQAKVRYLIQKAFPAKYKKQIKEMNISSLLDVLNNPDGIDENNEYNENILDEIKRVFTICIEDAQRSADEDEYCKNTFY